MTSLFEYLTTKEQADLEQFMASLPDKARRMTMSLINRRVEPEMIKKLVTDSLKHYEP